MTNQYEPVIGLEVHVQLKTATKIFCGCPTKFGAEPNRNTCPVCLGLPGSLPVLNERVLELAVMVGLALEAEISKRIKFDRKNYFYPDLPKAYQISQYDMPVCGKGYLVIDVILSPSQCHSERPQGAASRSEESLLRINSAKNLSMKDPSASPQDDIQITQKRIGITRAHLEEDAGKSIHEGVRDGTWVDYNRAGVPLLEIVSEPDLRSPREAFQYLTDLKAILQYLDVSDCNMEEGSLRCDANVSVRKVGNPKLGAKVEIKNMNSFRAVEKAVAYEISRQTEILEQDGRIVQETRLWDEGKGETASMRSKEHAHDYRYFPEPDLVPFSVPKERIEQIRKSLPELPKARRERFQKSYGLSPYDATVLVSDKELARYFEDCVKEQANPKLASNWIQSELLALLKANGGTLSASRVTAKHLAGLIRLIEDGTISGKIAKDVLPMMYEANKPAEQIVKEKGLVQVTDTKLIEEVVERVIAAHAKVVGDFKSGKEQAAGFLVGQVMKETKGKANPKMVNDILKQKLT